MVKARPSPSGGEPRGAIWCRIEHEGRPLNVFNTHLGLWWRERLAQARVLVGPDWLGHPDCRGEDAVLMGDFNSVPSSRAFREIARVLGLARPSPHRLAGPTFPARLPLLRLDHIFLSKGLRCLDCSVLRTPLARIASDHLPLLAVLERA